MPISTQTTLDDVIADIVSWTAGQSICLGPDFRAYVRERLTALLQDTAAPVRMVRPDWQTFEASIHADVLCSCNRIVQDFESLRYHWQQGHFDVVEVEPMPLTAQGDLRCSIAAQIESGGSVPPWQE